MRPSMLPARKHEITRVEAFSDAVFTFALTLLVVSLDVPRTYDELMRLMAGLEMNLVLQPWQLGNIFAIYGGGFVLMGPAHWIYGARVGRRRRALVAAAASPAAV